MNIRKVAFGLLTLSLILIISGGFSGFLIGLKNDKKETLNRMEVMNLKFLVLILLFLNSFVMIYILKF